MRSRRQAVLEAIREHFRAAGQSPSYREIGERTGLTPRDVRPHLDQLARDHLIEHRPGVARSISLVDRAANLSDTELEAACHGRGWTVTRSVAPALVKSFPVDPRASASDGDLLEILSKL